MRPTKNLDQIEHHLRQLENKGFTQEDIERLEKILEDVKEWITLKSRFIQLT